MGFEDYMKQEDGVLLLLLLLVVVVVRRDQLDVFGEGSFWGCLE